jgi:putative Holliday junction resolvase
MARIIALDIGGKRTGIAVTDPMQMIATGLEGIDTKELVPYLKKYMLTEQVDGMVIGKPMQMNNTESESWEFIQSQSKLLEIAFPDLKIEFYDERFTSKIALQSMKMAGAGKTDMKNKKTLDKVSAIILLQNYLAYKNNLKI